MAMDPERRRGGLLVLPKGKEQESMEIRIGPLVKVRGSMRGPGAGEKPSWAHVYWNLPDDPTRPLDSTRLVSCGSFEARFEVSLPPGYYVLHGYNENLDAFLVPDKEVDLAVGRAEVDLGVLMLSNTKSATSAKIAQAKSTGAWVNIADRYGKPGATLAHHRCPRHLQRSSDQGFQGEVGADLFLGVWLRPVCGEGLTLVSEVL